MHLPSRLDIQKSGLMSLLFVRLAWYWWREILVGEGTKPNRAAGRGCCGDVSQIVEKHPFDSLIVDGLPEE